MRENEALVFEASTPEVEKQADVQAGCFQVVDALDLKVGVKVGCHLQFDDDATLDHEVRDERPDDLIFVPHLDWPLLVDLQPQLLQLDHQRVLVDLLDEAHA